jgi:hypothetical protein
MKYLTSHKGCTIIFDDKRRCKDCSKAGEREEMIQSYLKGLTKLIVSVNVNNDWLMFSDQMQQVIDNMMNAKERTKHREGSCERT